MGILNLTELYWEINGLKTPNFFKNKNLYMKCALVTGGSRGIGSAICKKIASDTDYHILINYQSNKEAAEQTLEEVKN